MESITGLDIDGDGDVGIETPTHTILLSTYESAKDYYNQSRDYKLASSIINLTERVSDVVLAKTSPFTGVDTLEQIDQLIKPRLVSTDVIIAPYVAKSIEIGENAISKAKPVVALAYKVPLVERSVGLYSNIGVAAYGSVVKNLEKLSEKLLIENPEVTQ